MEQKQQPRRLGLHHLAIKSSDFEASLRFYTQGLGFQVALQFQEDGAAVALLDIGDGSYLELFAGGSRDGTSSPMTHFALRTDDCDAAIAQARAAGARITIEPTDAVLHGERVVAVRYAFCLGPDGEELEFLQSNDI